MKIKRFYASDMRQALRMVKEELGPDAVILSNNSSGDGIEIVAAKDYDERAVQKAMDDKEAAFDERIDKELKRGKKLKFDQKLNDVSVDLNKAPKQTYREEYTPQQLARDAQQKQAQGATEKKPREAVTATRASRPSQKSQWHEDPAIKAVRNELAMMRHEFRTQLNELSWADHTRQNPVRIDIIRRLLDTGFSKKLSVTLAETVTIETDIEQAWLACLKLASNSIPVLENDVLENGGVLAMLGPTGVGKTTTIAKIAARFRMRHGSGQLALITTDNYRIGAHEQLSNFARILDVPMRVASTHEELQDALSDFIDKRLVLIDTAGMSQRDLRITEQFELLSDKHFDIKNFLVISATTEARAMREVLKTFEGLKTEGCILTKLDETDCPGSALSAIIEEQIPVSFVTDGQRVPEDLHYADADELMSRFAQPIELSDEHDVALSVLLGGQSQHAYV